MCRSCWEEHGSHTIVSLETLQMAALLMEHEESLALHVVVEDWNLEDNDLIYCRDDGQADWGERATMIQMLNLTPEQRCSAMAIAEGFVSV